MLPHALNQIVKLPDCANCQHQRNLEPCEPEFTRAHADAGAALKRQIKKAHRAQIVHFENMNGREELAATKRTEARADLWTSAGTDSVLDAPRVLTSAIAARSIVPASSGGGVTGARDIGVLAKVHL